MKLREYGWLSMINFKWWALITAANDNCGGDGRERKQGGFINDR